MAKNTSDLKGAHLSLSLESDSLKTSRNGFSTSQLLPVDCEAATTEPLVGVVFASVSELVVIVLFSLCLCGH